MQLQLRSFRSEAQPEVGLLVQLYLEAVGSFHPSVFTVSECELWMNLVKAAFMMWSVFIKMTPPHTHTHTHHHS